MVDLVRANLSVEYEARNEGPPDIVLRKDDIDPPYGHALMRMYHVGPQPRVLSTSGFPVYVVNSAVVSEEMETITFNGSTTSNFPVPNVSNVSLQAIGRFFGLEGQVLNGITFSVDAARGQVRASEPLYGTLLASFNSTYQRLQCQFQTLPGADKDERYPSEFADMVVIAQQEAGIPPASLTLEAPDKNRKNGGMTNNDDSKGDAILLEVDTTYPVALTHRPRIAGLCAVAKVWAYSTHGNLRFSSSAGLVETPNVGRYIEEVIECEESINFVGSQSVSTKYPPVNGVTANKVGTVGSMSTPGNDFNFVTHPQIVTLAEWAGYGLYTTNGARQVNRNEIVAVTRGVAVPVTGQVHAKYNTRRSAAFVYWGLNGSNDWFPPATLVANDTHGNTSSIVLNPPQRRGI